MQRARRYWVGLASAAVLALVGAVAADPLLAGAGLVLGGWLLAHQAGFVRVVRGVTESEFTVETARERVAIDAPVVVRLRARTDRAFPVDLVASVALPPGADRPNPPATVSLAAGDRAAETAFETTPRVVGRLAVGPPVVDVRGAADLFTGTVRGDDRAVVTVQPRAPRDLHVGEGGDPLTSLYGEHKTDLTGAGLDPSGVREYVPGDQLSRIDWKATARLNSPHLREFDVQTTHETVLVVDHRASMAAGPEGGTKLDYLRQVALAFVNTADEYNDPLGLYAVGDGGTTTARDAAAGVEQYNPVRRVVRALDPTAVEPSAAPADGLVAPSRARARSLRLRDDDSRFAQTLQPYFAATERYVRRLDDRPLFQTVRASRGAVRDGAWTVILTDDTRPAETREAIKLARRNGGRVLVFLAPSVLYEPAADVEAASDRYLAFEELRRSLASIDRVSAFEVAPGDRLAAVIGGRRRARQAGQGVTQTGQGAPADGAQPGDSLAYSGSPRATPGGEDGGATDEPEREQGRGDE